MKRARIQSLAFFTVRELIQELVHRTTFVGLVLVSQAEHKKIDQKHTNFDTFAALPDPASVITLLKTAQEEIQKNHPG